MKRCTPNSRHACGCSPDDGHRLLHEHPFTLPPVDELRHHIVVSLCVEHGDDPRDALESADLLISWLRESERDRIRRLVSALPEDGATKSRDYGRGYAQCVRDIIELLEGTSNGDSDA